MEVTPEKWSELVNHTKRIIVDNESLYNRDIAELIVNYITQEL